MHLLSWTLIDWPRYALHGHARFPPPTHHAVTDKRDADSVLWDARASDGRACRDFHNPYAFPEECLTERGKAAAGAVVDLLVAIYKVRADARAAGQPASLLSSSGAEAATWRRFVREHLASVSAPAVLPTEQHSPLRRSDVFIGAQGLAGDQTLGFGAWGAKLFIGPAAPFVLALTSGAGYARSAGTGQLAAAVNFGLLLPLIRRFSIGASPVGVRVACDTHLAGCRADATAGPRRSADPPRRRDLAGRHGPDWSWTDRAIGRTWAGLAFGWSHQRAGVAIRRRPTRSRRGFRRASTRCARFAPRARPARSTWRRPWSRAPRTRSRASGWNGGAIATSGIGAPGSSGLQLEIDGGRIEQGQPGGGMAIAPTVRAYLLPIGWPSARHRRSCAPARSPAARSPSTSAPARASFSRSGASSSLSIHRPCRTSRARASTRCRSVSASACSSTDLPTGGALRTATRRAMRAATKDRQHQRQLRVVRAHQSARSGAASPRRRATRARLSPPDKHQHRRNLERDTAKNSPSFT